MKPLRFYEHFACAYGTLWLAIMAMAVLGQQHINAGEFGMFGFPIIALIYAFARKSGETTRSDEFESLHGEVRHLRQRLEEVDRSRNADP